MTPLEAQSPQVVFIGAGPIGLFTAIQTKLQAPQLGIVLIDRHGEYVRKQNLSIDPSSFDKLPSFEWIKTQWPQKIAAIDEFAQLVLQMKREKKIPIHELETRLSSVAKQLNIAVHREKAFSDVATLKQSFPEATLFVGADGAHSKVREVVFDNQMKVEENLQYTVAVKYWVKRGVSFNLYGSHATKKITGSVQEHVGKSDPEKGTPIVAQFFVEREIYERLQAYRAGNPLSLKELRTQDALLDAKIRVWLAAKAKCQQEEISNETIDVYTIKLPLYQSQHAMCQRGENAFFLVGDALFGVPFFRSINNGFLCGSKLSNAIVKKLSPDSVRKPPSWWKRIKAWVKAWFSLNPFSNPSLERTPEERYTAYVERLAAAEIRNARLKNGLLNLYQRFLEVSARVPWQVNRWQDRDVSRFTEFEPHS